MVRLPQWCLFLYFVVNLPAAGMAQAIPKNEYGLAVIKDVALYHESVKRDSTNRLVDIASYIPSIVLDIRYATANNFMNEPLYRLPKAFVRLPVAQALRQMQAELALQGLGLKIFDGYRPYSVTVYFYEKLQDSVFLAVPWRGSRHNRGSTLDLTLINLNTGKELEMPTAYDAISAKAHINYRKLPKKIIRNRELLKNIMHKYGFAVYAPEWWHYDFKDFARFDLLDIPFEELVR